MVYKVEPHWICKKTIRDEVVKKKLVFYDNNLLANPYIEDLLSELIQLRREKVITRCESQSGFDGRVLRLKPHLAQLLQEAGFKNPRIAWDGSVTLYKDIQEMVQILVDAGYKPGDISIFMIYNYNLTYTEVETKRSLIYQLGCQVNDCRYHPTTQTYDNYNPHKHHQSSRDYYIHPLWTDREVRLFRKNCRRHNICIRYRMSWHHPLVEYRRVDPQVRDMYREMSWEEIQSYLPDAWNPKEIHTNGGN